MHWEQTDPEEKEQLVTPALSSNHARLFDDIFIDQQMFPLILIWRFGVPEDHRALQTSTKHNNKSGQ